MTALKPEDFIPFAEQLATVSGEIIRRYFRQPIKTEHKSDNTPVTLADQEVERSVRAMIQSTYPEHGIIGEEYEPKETETEYTWMIDPIDGTKSFLIGRPIFGTLIALLHNEKPILGIIDQPILGERWTGVGGYATNFNYNPTRARACDNLSDAMLCTTSPNLFSDKEFDAFERLRKQVQYTIYGGDCYSYGLLASGLVDIVLETDLKPHDFCALVPIVEGAAGCITDWQGNPLTLSSKGNVLACSDKSLHQDVLNVLKK